MQMKTKIAGLSLLFILLVFVGGCETSSEYCQKIGFSYGTADFGKCVLYKDTMRELASNNAAENYQSYLYQRNINKQNIYYPSVQLRRNRSFNCTTNGIGNTLYTNCY
jgi:hypothetical protein